jgi:tetratricopeptide (TPR) repeat protein
MSLKQIKTLYRAKKFEKALASLEKLLARHKECPHLWNLRGDLIQLLDTQDGPPLGEAAKSYKTALRLDPNNLETLASLAHFYHAVEPKPETAKRYAEAYIVIAKRGLAEMERVIADEA